MADGLNNCFACDEPCGQAMMCAKCRAMPTSTSGTFLQDARRYFYETEAPLSPAAELEMRAMLLREAGRG